MGLVAKDGNLYLEEGWLEFVKHYQLAHGHMLIFSYGGRSNFNIIICDKTTYEIDYTPFTSPNLSSEESDLESEGSLKIKISYRYEKYDKIIDYLLMIYCFCYL